MVTKIEREKMKKMFLNCGCNFKGNSFIKDYKNCGNYVTCCKQCGKSLIPVGRLKNLRLFETKKDASEYRSKIFANPDEFLLGFMIPGPWESLNEIQKKLLKETF